MSPGGLLLVALALAAVPLGVLAVLLGFGALAPAPGLAAIAVVALGALGLAWLWLADLGRLADTLRNALQERRPLAAPRLPPLQRIAQAIERLTRILAARAGQVDDLTRANAAVVEQLPDPLLLLDAGRELHRANAAARAAFGGDLAAMLRHPALRDAIDAAWMGRGIAGADLPLAAPVARDLRASVIYLDPALADGSQALVVLSDRTRERMVERMRADFAANASHELRTPLASLIGFIDTLRGPAADDPAAQARFLAIMAEQAARMNRLIDDLLRLSHIELLEHQPPAEQVALGPLLARVAAAFEPKLAARRVNLVQDIAADLPTIHGDPEQLTQLAGNLIDNAVKYGREGGTVRMSASAASGGVALVVQDDGPGIPRAQVPRLTERFYRVDQGRGRREGGTGLGLAIVKHIVSRHRGQMSIESDVGRGVVFRVWLPE
jgi:two-component system phosphate regulon sensor histidine kinase PhoR